MKEKKIEKKGWKKKEVKKTEKKGWKKKEVKKTKTHTTLGPYITVVLRRPARMYDYDTRLSQSSVC